MTSKPTRILTTLIALVLLFSFDIGVLVSQPSTDLILFDMEISSDSVEISNPRNIYPHPGYDNQPHFIPGENSVLFSSLIERQTDVILYRIDSKASINLTTSAGSEYSPTLTPDGNHFSTIILEASGRQLLWKYSIEGKNPEIVVPDLKIGYHCWLDQGTLAAFVLGDPSTLQICRLQAQTNQVVASNIGRSIHKIPGTQSVSFVDKTMDPWMVKSYDPGTGMVKSLITCLPDAEDMAWTPDGRLILGKSSQLYQWSTNGNKWRLIKDLSQFGYRNITRLAVNGSGDKIIVVVDEAE